MICLGLNLMIVKASGERGHGRRGAALTEPLSPTGHQMGLARVALNCSAYPAKTHRSRPQHQEYHQQPEPRHQTGLPA